MKSDEELKRDDPELYKVARENNTEAPHIGKYVHEKADGMYHCAVCDSTLFSSDTKFDSGSGWPSFTNPEVEKAVILRKDSSHGMERTDVRCATCDAHLGHVFPDGPEKGGKVCDRYCINGISLNLNKK